MSTSKLAGLICCLIITIIGYSQKNFGNNSSAGHYFNVGDCKLYYEVYGQGKPLVLLHGGVYGYIDEFAPFIENLSRNYQVICIATRGHGKSEVGHVQYSYDQRADDAYKIIRSLTKDSVIVLGFSDGGYAAMKLAVLHPEVVKKLIVIGAGNLPRVQAGKHRYEPYTPENLMKTDSLYFIGRLGLMPEPGRWGESLAMLNKMYDEEVVGVETFEKIKCATLLMVGEKDVYQPIEEIVKCKKAIAGSQLAIIPGCGHVVFLCNFPMVWNGVEPFLRQ